MLILARYKYEEIYIGDNIRIVVTDIRGNRVRICIIAPPSVAVHRSERYKHSVAALSIGASKEATRLVLTRKKDEVIRIGDDIRLIVVDVRRDSVRIGIEAPPSVTVDREEIHMAKKSRKQFNQATRCETSSVINVRPFTASKITDRKEVVPVT